MTVEQYRRWIDEGCPKGSEGVVKVGGEEIKVTAWHVSPARLVVFALSLGRLTLSLTIGAGGADFRLRVGGPSRGRWFVFWRREPEEPETRPLPCPAAFPRAAEFLDELDEPPH